MSTTEQKPRIVRKTLRVRDLPEGWNARVLGEPDAPVTVTIAAAKAAPARPLASYIAAGKGIYSSASEADAHIRQERDAWEE